MVMVMMIKMIMMLLLDFTVCVCVCDRDKDRNVIKLTQQLGFYQSQKDFPWLPVSTGVSIIKYGFEWIKHEDFRQVESEGIQRIQEGWLGLGWMRNPRQAHLGLLLVSSFVRKPLRLNKNKPEVDSCTFKYPVNTKNRQYQNLYTIQVAIKQKFLYQLIIKVKLWKVLNILFGCLQYNVENLFKLIKIFESSCYPGKFNTRCSKSSKTQLISK